MKIDFKKVKINLGQMHKKDTVELIFTLALLCILILAIISGIRKTKKPKYPKPKPISTVLKKDSLAIIKVSAGTQYGQIESISFRKLEREVKDLQLSRDPFVPSTIVASKDTFYSELRLTGIFWDEETPSAIINGMIVGIGDEVGSNRVVGITPNSVILNDGLSDFSLRLEQ